MSTRRRRTESSPAGHLPAPDAADDALWPRAPRDLDLSFVSIDGEEFAVLSHPLDAPLDESVARDGLTDAERQVTSDIVEGLSNAQIARRRGTTPSTIAKQVASAFRKLGVGSRRELVAMTKGRAP